MVFIRTAVSSSELFEKECGMETEEASIGAGIILGATDLCGCGFDVQQHIMLLGCESQWT